MAFSKVAVVPRCSFVAHIFLALAGGGPLPCRLQQQRFQPTSRRPITGIT
jgi:hypothetical protein